MSSQHGVRFHDLPATECTSMDVDEPSESRMSLDSLDDIYLGPDEELDSDFRSSAGPDVLDEIPTQSHPAQGDDLSLLNAPDMYLGPKDDLIEFDDGPAMPNSPMIVNGSMPEPHLASPDVLEAPIPSQSATPRHQLPVPSLNNEELHAMIQKLMSIRSYDQTKIQTIVDSLGDYHQRYEHVPDPTVAQLLEADRPFRNAWADTSDKLLKADADLRRMQRVRDSTSKLLKVSDTLISSFEDPFIM
ncbi:hypothetical protein EDD22DRAFT_925244 [Suillus occidentalis]|nr:hypothetical protein EDD22DRAFT_925244 [Suillus occidentalis]